MTNEELVAYYAGLLILQYVTKPKASGTVSAFARQMVADQVVAQVRDGFDLNAAVGQQLDLLGGYRGAIRTVFGLNLSRQYFSMPAYNDGDIGTVKGFAVYGQTQNDVTWYWLQYPDVLNPVYSLTDDELRRLIKFRAQVHQSEFGYGDLDAILFTFFANNVNLIDHQDMTIEYHHDPADMDTLFTIVNQTNSLPRPAGVAVSVS